MATATLHKHGTVRPTRIPLGNPWEAWRLGWVASELWMTSAYDLMSRTNWLTGADPSRSAARQDWQRLWGEEVAAGLEVAMEVQRAGYELWFGRFNPWHTSRRVLRPLHRRTTANARRLARRDRAGA